MNFIVVIAPASTGKRECVGVPSTCCRNLDTKTAQALDLALRSAAPDGRAVEFSGSTTFTPVQGDFHGQLVQNGNGSYTLTFKDGVVAQS